MLDEGEEEAAQLFNLLAGVLRGGAGGGGGRGEHARQSPQRGLGGLAFLLCLLVALLLRRQLLRCLVLVVLLPGLALALGLGLRLRGGGLQRLDLIGEEGLQAGNPLAVTGDGFLQKADALLGGQFGGLGG